MPWIPIGGGGGGVEVEDDTTPVATATTINFGDNLTVTDDGGGVVTVDATGGGGGGGALVYLEEVSVSAASALVVDLPPGYLGFEIRGLIDISGAGDLQLRVGDGSIDSGTNYDWASSFGGDSSGGQSGDGATFVRIGVGSTEAEGSSIAIRVLAGYDDSGQNTYLFFTHGYLDGTAQFIYDVAAKYRVDNVVDLLQIFPSAGTITGTVQVWALTDDTGGGSGDAAPEWVSYLKERQSDETAHVDDEFFAAGAPASFGGTVTTVSGSATWLVGRNLLSAVFEDQTSGDMSAALFAITSASAPMTVESCFSLMVPSGDSYQIGVGFTDGTTATDDVAWAAYFSSASAAGWRLRHGTLTSFLTTNSTMADTIRAVVAGPMYARIAWESSNQFHASWSVDGVSWTSFGDAAITPTMTPTHMALIVSSNGATVPGIAKFHYMRVYDADLVA